MLSCFNGLNKDLKMNSLTLPLIFMLAIGFSCAICTGEEGDQILDGIGETDLIARYLFSGDAEDASRHSRHATLHGTKGTFVDKELFISECGQTQCLGGR